MPSKSKSACICSTPLDKMVEYTRQQTPGPTWSTKQAIFPSTAESTRRLWSGPLGIACFWQAEGCVQVWLRPPNPRPEPYGITSCTAPWGLPEAALSKMSVIAEAIRLFLKFILISISRYFCTKSKCFKKNACTVASMPQGPPLSWKMAYCIF